MPFRVLLTRDAVRDLEELYDYIASHDSPANADRVLNKIERVLSNLHKLPARGSRPKELVTLGIREYREVFFKPYRIIYRVIGKEVYVYLIADARRDLQSLLARRVLDG